MVSSSDAIEVQRIDRDVAELAARQYGLITRSQLEGIPLAAGSIAQRVAAGRIHRIFRGVYSVGHEVLTREGVWLAAVLASGPTAALSHRSAATHLRLIAEAPDRFTEVTAATRGRRAQHAIRLYESTRQPSEQFNEHRRIRTTSPARTIADLAAVTTRRRVERAMGRAEILYSLSVKELLDAARYRKGAPTIRLILGSDEAVMTRSELEDRFLALVARAGLPAPRTNKRLGGFEVDFFFERQRVVVETDGDADHLARPARHRDRQRDARLETMGFHVLRFGWEQVVRRPGEVVAALESALRLRSAVVSSPGTTKMQRIA